jgi:hypothetical protein
MNVRQISDYSDGTTTINGTSIAIPLNSDRYKGEPFTVQIYDGSSPVGTIQGIIYNSTGDDADTSTLWQDLTNGTISDDGFFSFYAPVTHIRVNLTSGTCKARILN